LKHVIRERSADGNQSDEDEEEYEEYEEDYEDDQDEESEGKSVEMETVARIRVVWSSDEEDLYVDNHLQTARMWGIVQGTEGEDFISIKEDDMPPPNDSTMFFTFSTQASSECRILFYLKFKCYNYKEYHYHYTIIDYWYTY
jgi:hypothetical protein